MYCNNYPEFTLKFADCSGVCHFPGGLPHSHVLGSSPAAGFGTMLCSARGCLILASSSQVPSDK